MKLTPEQKQKAIALEEKESLKQALAEVTANLDLANLEIVSLKTTIAEQDAKIALMQEKAEAKKSSAKVKGTSDAGPH